MYFLKQLVWTVITAAALWFVHTIFIGLFLYPYGGGAFHAIFAYSAGGRFDVADRVFNEYTIVMSVLTVALILFRSPLQWFLIALAGATVCTWDWWMVCSFPYQSDNFHLFATRLLPLVPIPVVYCCAVARWLQKEAEKDRRLRPVITSITPDGQVIDEAI